MKVNFNISRWFRYNKIFSENRNTFKTLPLSHSSIGMHLEPFFVPSSLQQTRLFQPVAYNLRLSKLCLYKGQRYKYISFTQIINKTIFMRIDFIFLCIFTLAPIMHRQLVVMEVVITGLESFTFFSSTIGPNMHRLRRPYTPCILPNGTPIEVYRTTP